ncbi:CREB-regulated transcription coactivator 1-like isoform X3, partial [Dinothrombium tinctorium]
MANPRKFSEKIALHNQKQAEETAAFEQIMREVMGATRGGSAVPVNAGQVKNQHLHITQTVGNLRAGSLPNVNHIGTQQDRNSGIDLQTALNNLDDIRHGRDPMRDRRHASPTTFHRIPHSVHHHSGHHRQTHFDQKRIDSSPYSTVYLSPPPADTQWRRTNSDSALHHTAMMSEQQENENLHGGLSPRRSTVHDVDSSVIVDNLTGAEPSNLTTPLSWDPGKKLPNHLINQHLLTATSLPMDSRPKSCEVPGITIYPSQEDPNVVHHHIPISSNTGSLPDLTNLHFPAPLSTPIDVEDQTLMNNSVDMNHHQQPASPYSVGSPHNPNGSPSYDPRSPYSPNSPHNNYSPPPNTHHNNNNGMLQTRINNGNLNGNHASAIIDDCHANRASSPNVLANRRQQNDVEALVLENVRLRHRVSSPCDPQQVCYFLRNGSNVTVEQQNVNRHRTATPSDHSCSAPTSPVSHSMSPIGSPGLAQNNAPLSKSPFTDNSYYNVQQTNVLQHQLEQFKMVTGTDLQQESSERYLMMPDANGHSSSSSASSSTGVLYTSANTYQQSPGGSVEGTSDYSPQQSPQSTLVSSVEAQHQQPSSIYYTAPSQRSTNNSMLQTTTPLIYSKSVISSSSPTYQQPKTSTTSATGQSPTAHTPTSIPDIILT